MQLRAIVLFSWITCAPLISAAPTDEASLTAAVDQPAQRLASAVAEIKRLSGPLLDQIAREPNGERFLAFLFSENVAPTLLHSGSISEPFDQTIQSLLLIWRADASGLSDPHELSTALATALTFSDKNWPAEQAVARYTYYRDSRRQGLLHPSFDKLLTWEKRYVMRGGGNGTHNAANGWDNASLVWLRDNVKLPIKDYTGACWQAPYRLNNVFGDSIHGANYYLPFGHYIHAERVREIGGVCGSLSHYGANAAIANGIPALTMGEPGHCAYAVRTAADEWTPAYSLSWERGLHCSLWPQHTWTSLMLQNKVLAERYAHERSAAFLWQARALKNSAPDLAEDAYRLALESQPLHQPAWLEAVKFRLERKPDAASCRSMHQAALASLKDYPEAAWDVISLIEAYLVPLLPEAEKVPFLTEYHKAIAKIEGPVMWHFDRCLKEQSALLGTTDAKLAHFEAVLTCQTASKSWFAPTIAWGQAEFTKDPALAEKFYAALGRAFSSSTAGENPDGLRAALRPAILSAAESNNVSAFQTLGQAGKSFLPTSPIAIEPFPGDLLSSGGLLKLSSTSGWDAPEMHWGVLEPMGGTFHTDRQVHAGCVVRLGKLGDLSGLVIVNAGGGQNGPRQIPLRVSVSEDGTQWKTVFEATENAPHWRIPLAGKANRVQFVKCERSDDRSEFFHLTAIHAYGKKLQ